MFGSFNQRGSVGPPFQQPPNLDLRDSGPARGAKTKPSVPKCRRVSTSSRNSTSSLAVFYVEQVALNRHVSPLHAALLLMAGTCLSVKSFLFRHARWRQNTQLCLSDPRWPLQTAGLKLSFGPVPLLPSVLLSTPYRLSAFRGQATYCLPSRRNPWAVNWDSLPPPLSFSRSCCCSAPLPQRRQMTHRSRQQATCAPKSRRKMIVAAFRTPFPWSTSCSS